MKIPALKINPPEDQSPFWWFRWVPTIVISALILYFLYVVGSVAIVPVLASFALAYLLNPIVYAGYTYGTTTTPNGGHTMGTLGEGPVSTFEMNLGGAAYGLGGATTAGNVGVVAIYY